MGDGGWGMEGGGWGMRVEGGGWGMGDPIFKPPRQYNTYQWAQ